MIWSGIDIFFREGLGFIFTVVLARLLLPEDFGTLALLGLFLAIANVFVNAGFTAALIRMQDASILDESTVFWFNLCASLLAALGLCLAAPWIAEFLALEVLYPLTMLMAVNVVIGSLGAIQSTLFTKGLDFRTPMRVGAIATITSGVVGVSLAFSGYGVWSLAWQAVTSTVVSTSLLWYFSSWRPVAGFSRDSFRRMFSFGGWVFASNMLEAIYQRGYTVLVGKMYGIYDLGIYKQADNMQLFPASILTRILSQVSFPVFSSASHDKTRLKRWVRLSVRSAMLVCAPTMVGLGILAEPIIGMVFGSKWLPAAPVLQVLCFIGLFWPLHVINLNVLQAQGHSRLNFRLSIAKKTTGIALLLIGSLFGVMGVAWSRVIQSVIALVINGLYSKKLLDYSMWEQIKDCLSSLVLSVVMAGVVVLCEGRLEIGGLSELLALVFIGFSFYLVSNLLLGASAFKDAYSFLRNGSAS